MQYWCKYQCPSSCCRSFLEIAFNLIISLGVAIFGLQLVGNAVAQVIQTHASTGISLFFLNGYCTTLRGANVSTITCIALFICTYHKWTVVVMCTGHNDAIVCALPDDSAAGYLQLRGCIHSILLFCGLPVPCTLHLHWLLCAYIWGPQSSLSWLARRPHEPRISHADDADADFTCKSSNTSCKH